MIETIAKVKRGNFSSEFTVDDWRNLVSSYGVDSDVDSTVCFVNNRQVKELVVIEFPNHSRVPVSPGQIPAVERIVHRSSLVRDPKVVSPDEITSLIDQMRFSTVVTQDASFQELVSELQNVEIQYNKLDYQIREIFMVTHEFFIDYILERMNWLDLNEKSRTSYLEDCLDILLTMPIESFFSRFDKKLVEVYADYFYQDKEGQAGIQEKKRFKDTLNALKGRVIDEEISRGLGDLESQCKDLKRKRDLLTYKIKFYFKKK